MRGRRAAAVRRWRVWIVAVVGLVVAGGATYLGRVRMLTAIGAYLIVQDVPQPSDAIVVLSGSLPDRILEGVDLYLVGLAPRIVLTQETPLPGLLALRARGGTMRERHEQNLDIARQLGVPASALAVVSTPAWSTVTEAEALVAYFQEQGIHSIVLVTSKAHARRARLVFRDLTRDAVRVLVVPSRYDPFVAAEWWRHRPWARRVCIEYLKLLNYVCVDRWRLHRSGGPA